MLLTFIRWGLRLHSVFHIFEFVTAIYESAYITAVIAFMSALIQYLGSVYLPKEHIHVGGFIPDIHENCDNEKKS
jgi:hypothetical protein